MQTVIDLSGGLYLLPDTVAAAGLRYGECLDIQVQDGCIVLSRQETTLRVRRISRQPAPVVAADVAAIETA